MSCLKCGLSVSGSRETIVKNRTKGSFSGCSSVGTLPFKDSKLTDFWRKSLDGSDHGSVSGLNIKAPQLHHISVRAPISVGKSLRWWEKSLQPNMIEIHSAQELVDYLLIAGDRLVILGFYSPGCGGCKALHPKICQLADMNPNSTFLMVNYEQQKTMCHALHVHVLPFFRFYRGADGRVCSFSCTNATIKKFKDALTRHGTDRCSLYPATGLNFSELSALESVGEISGNLIPNSAENSNQMEDLLVRDAGLVISTLKDKTKEGNSAMTT